MQTILLVIHLIIALAIIILVLLQRSEGGALGIGGGGGNNFMSGRALGNALTRTTAILAALFFMTSIGLTLLSTSENRSSVLDSVIETQQGEGSLGQFDTPLPALPIPSDTP